MPRSPSHGIATGLKYGAAIWIGAAVIAYGGYCALDMGREASKHIKLAHQEAFSSFRIANGGVR